MSKQNKYYYFCPDCNRITFERFCPRCKTRTRKLNMTRTMGSLTK